MNLPSKAWSIALLIALLVVAIPAVLFADVDERPLNVQIVPAFPNFQWPDWILGLDTGRSQQPRPIVVTGAGDGTDRIFVASQYGAVFVLPNDPAADATKLFLDIRDNVQYDDRENEEGFLGLAFHPKFKENGEFFVYYTAAATREEPHLSVISRFKVAKDDPNRADRDSEEVILTIRQPYWNHNGGTIVFGPDGYLYVGLGDGGAANDPHMNGQNLQTLLGKILRIDVDHRDPGKNYAIPPDNPFVGNEMVRGEIWAYGLRNVWRMSFDRQTGVCWAADVGQNLWEEVDIITKGGNYGWNLREGKHAFLPPGNELQSIFIEPVVEYHHEVGKSVTGGNVYRGRNVPELEGAYLYADYITGEIWALWYDFTAGRVEANRTILPRGQRVTTFGEDDQGEVYFATEDGGIFRFASPKSTAGASP